MNKTVFANVLTKIYLVTKRFVLLFLPVSLFQIFRNWLVFFFSFKRGRKKKVTAFLFWSIRSKWKCFFQPNPLTETHTHTYNPTKKTPKNPGYFLHCQPSLCNDWVLRKRSLWTHLSHETIYFYTVKKDRFRVVYPSLQLPISDILGLKSSRLKSGCVWDNSYKKTTKSMSFSSDKPAQYSDRHPITYSRSHKQFRWHAKFSKLKNITEI